MRFAYADPPYLGCAKRIYGDRHPDAAIYDTVEAHAALVARLVDEFPEGWALSLHTPSLRTILGLCPPEVRVAAWVKSWCSWKPTVNPAYAWEPVIFKPGRKPDTRTRDWLKGFASMGKALKGQKPPEFCEWVLNLLGYQDGDELVDIFPGTGIMGAVAAQGRLVL